LVNLFYSTFARNQAYLDIAIGALTYPLRTWMGAQLVDIDLGYLPLLAVYFLAILMVSKRRLLEARKLNWVNHKGYSNTFLKYLSWTGLAGTVIFAMLAGYKEPYLHARIILFAGLFAFSTSKISNKNSLLLIVLCIIVMYATVPYAIVHERVFFVSDCLVSCTIIVLLATVFRKSIINTMEQTFIK